MSPPTAQAATVSNLYESMQILTDTNIHISRATRLTTLLYTIPHHMLDPANALSPNTHTPTDTRREEPGRRRNLANPDTNARCMAMMIRPCKYISRHRHQITSARCSPRSGTRREEPGRRRNLANPDN
jgi:hypothetical protein